jgi:hypothetical protein
LNRLRTEVQLSGSRSQSKMLRRAFFFIGPVALCLCFAPASASAQNASPACSTFDTRNRQTSTFRASEAFVIRGTGFGNRSTVIATFRQGVRAAELGRVQTSDLGAFSMPEASIPDTAEPGNGSLVVVDGPRSATCDLTIEAGSAAGNGDSDTPTILFIAWGAALAIVAALLAIITLRRWQRGRLHRAMADLPQTQDDLEPDSIEADEKGPRTPARVPWLELDDVEIVELGADELGPGSSEGDDDDLEEDTATIDSDDLQDLIDELEEDADGDDEEPPPARRRVVYRERSKRESDLERLIPVTVPDEEEAPPPPPAAPSPPEPRPRPGPARSGSNVDRLKDAVKDWQTREADSSEDAD